MPIMNFSADAVTINNGDRASTIASRGKVYQPIEALRLVQNEIEPGRADLVPEAFKRKFEESLAKHMPPAVRATREGLQTSKREQAARQARITTVEGLDPHLASEDRQAFRALSSVDKRVWVRGASKDELAAVVSVGRNRWPDMADDMWSAATDRLALLVFSEQAGVIALHPKRATAADPAPVGYDAAAVEAHAATAMAEFRAEQAAVKVEERTLRDVINATAVLLDFATADQAHAWLVANGG